MAKILHVEDQVLWRDVVSEFFIDNGHEVVSLCSLGKARKEDLEPYDLIIVDGNLGEYKDDGVVWAEELFNNGKNVILLRGPSCTKTKVPEIYKGDFVKRSRELLSMF